MRQHNSFSSTLAMALLMAVGASFISCPAATAQSKAAAATQTAASDDRVEARPADVSGLAGKKIDYASYKNYVTTGRPEGDGDKVFLLYNVGTGKFLNVGSYWGIHAALSNVPRPFWFQHRNEQRVAGQWAYNRFPESADADKGYFYNDFFALTTLQVGNTEGKKRSHVKYEWLRVVDAKTGATVRDIIPEGTNADGAEYTFTKELTDFDFNKYSIVARIDMTHCTATTSGGGNMEALLSLGQDVKTWSRDVSDLHIYGFRSGGKSYLRVQPMDSLYADATHKSGSTENPIEIGDDNIVDITVAQQSVRINGVQCMPRVYTYDSAIKPLLALSTLNVGSTQGDVRTHATYNYVKLHSASSQDGDQTDIVTPGYVCGGRSFSKSFSGSLTDKEVTAEIDLTTCKGTNENILSIGTDIKSWGASGTTHNLHMYYTASSGTLKIQPVNKSQYSNGTPCVTITGLTGTTITIKANSTGLYVNDVKRFEPTHAVMAYLIGSATTIQVGSLEGDGRSYATYSYLRMTGTSAGAAAAQLAPKRAEASASATDTYIYKDKACDGTALKSDDLTVNFADGDYLEADIDLSACTNKFENVFSIGNAIDDWGNKAGQHNIHFYWIKRTTLDDGTAVHLLQVAYVNNDHPSDFKRAVYVPVGETLHIRLSKDGLIVNGRDIYPSQDPMPHLTYGQYHDYAGEIVRVKQDEYGNRLLDSDGHFIIDMDGGHGVKSSYNGYIYTTESRTAQSMPLFISSRFKQETVASGNEDVFFAWAPHLVNNNKWGTIGVFADRALPSAELTADQSTACSQWYFEEAPGSTEGNHMYRIYLRMDNAVIHEITSDGKLATKVVSGTQNFYLQADADEMLGNSYEHYPDGSDLTALTSVEAKPEMPATAANAYWKVFSMNEYYKMFKSEKSEMTSMLDLTFLMRDASFGRENAELSAWTADGDFSGNRLRIGYDHYSKKTTADTDYSDDNGKLPVKGTDGVYDYTDVEWQYSALKNRTNNHARYMGVDVRGGANGKFYQDVTVDKQGWYAVTCGGMSNAGAQLFVQQVKKDGSVSAPVYQKLHALTADELATFKASSQQWPFDYVSGGMPMYNALVAINDDAIQPNFKQKYTTQVVFFADPDVLAAGGGSITLRVGVEIPAASAVSTQASDDATSTDDDAYARWTVFDDFHLLFGGMAQEPNLMLDEDFTSMDYLDETAHVFNLHPLRLHRTFTGGKWNTLILPVNLSKSDFASMFGSTARLAQLDHLTATTVEFVSAPEEGGGSESTGTDDEGNATSKDIYLHAFKPYIIWVDEQHTQGNGKVDEEHPDGDGQDYSAPLAYRANTSTFNTVSVPANHFYLASATLAARHSDDAGQYYYSFRADTEKAKDITFPFATAHTTGDLYTYRDAAAATDESGTNAPLRAYGSLCMNYDADNMTILDGRPTLGGGYVMSKGTMRRVKSRYGTKGLRCWFMPESADGQQLTSEVKVAIDGVEDTTTSISDLFADEPAATARFADGIYNAAGQKIASSTDSASRLAPGLYIVGGRKFVKK